jgi:uncharacterized protein (TIGR03437 family)
LLLFAIALLKGQCSNPDYRIEGPYTLPTLVGGLPYSYQFRVVGAPGPHMYFFSGSVATGNTFSISSSGIFSGVPQPVLSAHPGIPFSIVIGPENSRTLRSTCQFRLPMVPMRMRLSPDSLPIGFKGAPYFRQLNVVDGVPPFRFENFFGAPPPGLKLSSSGQITGTPSVSGNFRMRLSIRDSVENWIPAELNFVIDGPSLRFETKELPNANRDEPYQASLRLAGNPMNPACSIIGGVLPLGVSMNQLLVISGTPTSSASYPFVVRCFSGDAAGDGFHSLLVIPLPGLRMEPFVGNFQKGLAVNLPFPVMDAIGEVRVTLLEGAIPLGLSVSPKGQLTGTPLVSGEFSSRWQAVDSTGARIERTYTLKIDPPRPYLKATARQRYSHRDNLPDATRYAVEADSRLPLGLLLAPDGTLAGTPFASGEYMFQLRVGFSEGPDKVLPYGLSVAPAMNDLKVETVDLPSAILNRPYRQNLLSLPAADYVQILSAELPPGLSLKGNFIEGTPTRLGSWEFLLDLRAGRLSSSRRYSITVHDLAVPQPNAVVNSASYQAGAVAAGEIVTVFGVNLDDIRPLIDGTVSPLLYATPTQASFIVPFSAASRDSIDLILERKGMQSFPLRLGVTAAKPGIYTQNGSGQGPAAALNQDASLNTEANPAAAGSVIVVYGTGLGELEDSVVDGTPAVTAALARVFVARQLGATLDGEEINVLYAGAAPGLIHGAAQVNLQLPATLVAGRHRLRLSAGGRQSPEVEVWVK